MDSLYQRFLDGDSCSIFLNFVLQRLQEIPMEKWPKKANIIVSLFAAVSRDGQLVVARTLEKSLEKTTVEIGQNLAHVILALSLRDAAPHLEVLTKLLHLNSYQIEKLFGFPFIEFRQDPLVFKDDPVFTRRLSFNCSKKVFLYQSLVIGVYYPGQRGEKLPKWLLAYNKETEKLAWGIPLTPDFSQKLSNENIHYRLNQVGEFISLQFFGEKKVHMIWAENGIVSHNFEMSEIFQDQYVENPLHIHPSGYSYQMVRKGRDHLLIGGLMKGVEWEPLFHSKATGFFSGLATHCGFHSFSENKVL